MAYPVCNLWRTMLLATMLARASCNSNCATTSLQYRKALKKPHQLSNGRYLLIARGGDSTAPPSRLSEDSPLDIRETVSETVALSKMLPEIAIGLKQYMSGPKTDTLLLLVTTALVTPVCKLLKTSPILGFLATGILFGPNGRGLIRDIHTTEMLADLGIVFFLFEMGIHLNFDTLLSMRKDVFGLGLSQFVITSLAIAGIAAYLGLSSGAMVVLGGGLALSSSAFVLQLLKDKDQLQTQYGKSSFGVLLLQDLAVVPLLLVTRIMSGSGEGLAKVLGSAFVKASIAVGAIAFAGRFLLNPLFAFVAKSQSQEAFLGLILTTVLSMSFLTEGLGLSNTLGAFLAGVLLSESKYRHEVEKEISPFRGVLVGLFFFTVGFEIDLNLIASKFTLVSSIVIAIMVLKALIATLLCLAFDLKMATSQQVGLILSQGGEFAFVAFRLARSLGILDSDITKLMLTCVSLTMAITPFLEDLGGRIARRLTQQDAETEGLLQSSGELQSAGHDAASNPDGQKTTIPGAT